MSVTDPDRPLTRNEASAAVGPAGWRYLLGDLRAVVPVDSLVRGVELAAAAVAAAGDDADGHLRVDLRSDRIELAVRDRSSPTATQRDTEIVGRIASAVEGLGHRPAGAASLGSDRPVEMLELAIDALDIPAVRPFWKAVLDYVDEPGAGPDGGIVDPAGQLPSVWFQQMDAPRPQRNRIHFDVTVAHDEADARVAAALAAGGRLLDDSHARAYWVLADAEGNEACVCTWTDRDRVKEE